MVHSIAYEISPQLNWPVPREHQMDDAIKALGTTWCRIKRGQFLVQTELPEATIIEHLGNLVYAGEHVFVNRIYRSWAGYNLDDDQVRWLRDPARNFGSVADIIATFLPSPFSVLGKLALGGAK